jgi:hypothetical protein
MSTDGMNRRGSKKMRSLSCYSFIVHLYVVGLKAGEYEG